MFAPNGDGSKERVINLGGSDEGFHLGDFTSKMTWGPSRTND